MLHKFIPRKTGRRPDRPATPTDLTAAVATLCDFMEHATPEERSSPLGVQVTVSIMGLVFAGAEPVPPERRARA